MLLLTTKAYCLLGLKNLKSEKGENIMEKNILENAPVATRPQTQALVDIEQQRAISEVQGAIILAKRYPRNQIEAMDRIMVACQRPGLAEQALYSYAKGGTEITGPSIRLAEAVIS